MENILIKFFDEEVDFEAFLLVDKENVNIIDTILEKYKYEDEEYNWDGFIQLLRANNVKFKEPLVQEVYF